MVAAVPEEAGAGPHRGPVVFEPERQSAETKRALLEAYHAKCVSLGFRSRGAGTIGPFMKRQSRRLDGRLTGGRREPARGGVGERDRLRRGRWE